MIDTQAIVDRWKLSGTSPPVYKMQSAKSRPYFAPRKRDAEFYRNRRTKKAIRKLPF